MIAPPKEQPPKGGYSWPSWAMWLQVIDSLGTSVHREEKKNCLQSFIPTVPN